MSQTTMNRIKSADFQLHIELMIDALKTRDQQVINLFKEPFDALMGATYVADLLTASLYHLARTDADTCRWVLRNCYDTKPFLEMQRKAISSAYQVLYRHGFIRGTDFRIYADENLWLSPEAEAYLNKSISPLDQILLESASIKAVVSLR